MRGRFAPSPTGDLHLGSALIALCAWLRVRARSDRSAAFVVRVEDLDPPRVIEGATERILEDLAWLGVDWDEGPPSIGAANAGRSLGPHAPYLQSQRGALYDAAIAQLEAHDLVYPCTCTRAELARSASAPHQGEEGPRYPGTCRDPRARKAGRPSALRLRVADDEQRVVRFVDAFAGEQEQDVAQSVGDFVLRRADGVASYQLAVVVDDLAMKIDEVVRGDDLLSSTARQILLARLLGGSPPSYAHVPVVRGLDGERLAKRHQRVSTGSTIAELRARRVTREEILGELAYALGLADDGAALAPEALLERARLREVRPRSGFVPRFLGAVLPLP